MSESLLIKGGRIIDPAHSIDEIGDLLIENGRIVACAPHRPLTGEKSIDASGLIVAPGLIDMHVHLREPGQEQRETIESGTAAAVAGGFTAVACMPNTDPPLDNDSEIEFVLRQAERTAHCRVFPIGAITRERKGEALAEIGSMARVGAVGFTDDGDGVANAAMCLRAMRYVSMFDKLFIQHCEDKSLASGGCMNAGVASTRLGLPGISAAAEDVMVQRDILLARQSNVRYHVAHISTAASVELVRQAKRAGERVSTEVCPHHLLLTDEACSSYDTNFKMNPPLRSKSDVDACIEGVRDGTIDCLVTDHAPHAHQDKQMEFQAAPFGIIGLETALGLFIKSLVESGLLSWPRLISAMSTRPAQLLHLELGTLRPDAVADVTLIDPNREWLVNVEAFRSRSRNCPFDGWKLRGKAVMTIVGGKIQYTDTARN